MDASLYGFDELRNVGVAGVETGEGVDDADDGAGQGVVAVSGGFDEGFAEEKGEVGVAVGGETLAEAGGGVYRGAEVVVGKGWVVHGHLVCWGSLTRGFFLNDGPDFCLFFQGTLLSCNLHVLIDIVRHRHPKEWSGGGGDPC